MARDGKLLAVGFASGAWPNFATHNLVVTNTSLVGVFAGGYTREELDRIHAPTLIVASERDRHCPPKAAEIIAAGIKGSRLEVMSDAGHPIPVEKPRELARSITSFLND